MIDYEKLKEEYETFKILAIKNQALISLTTYFTPDGQVVFKPTSIPGTKLPFTLKRIE